MNQAVLEQVRVLTEQHAPESKNREIEVRWSQNMPDHVVVTITHCKTPTSAWKAELYRILNDATPDDVKIIINAWSKPIKPRD